MSKKITVSEVANYLGVSTQFVRIGMQKGALPIGSVISNGTTNTYIIYPKALYEVTGMKAEGYEPRPEINTSELAEEIVNKLLKAVEKR